MKLDSVFVYEFVTGGGCFGIDAQPTGSLLAEGAAMLQAVVADFAEVADLVYIMWDERLPRELVNLPTNVILQLIANRTNENTAFVRIAKQCEKTLLIAPETDHQLRWRAVILNHFRRPLVSPTGKFIEVAADKNQTAELLTTAGVRVPRGRKYEFADPWPPQDIHCPFVLKPADGCGSDHVRLITSPNDPRPQSSIRTWRIEEFCPGLPASIAVLCGPNQRIPLAATKQRLSTDGRFTYIGGDLPLSPDLQQRAENLALAALATLPPANGYVGIDLILGEAPDGSDDYVIEINPRLTTSYIGLRQLYKTNLAAAMLQVIAGEPCVLELAQSFVTFNV